MKKGKQYSDTFCLWIIEAEKNYKGDVFMPNGEILTRDEYEAEVLDEYRQNIEELKNIRGCRI